MSNIARRLGLKDNHPTMVKLNKIADLASELGISFSFYGQSTVITDNEREDSLPCFYLEDLDRTDPVNEFPPTVEFKIVYDNPAYLEQQRLEQEEYNKKWREKEAKAKAAQELADKQAKERALELQEMKERATLAALKSKYEK